MKIISVNIRGLGESGKKGWVKSIIRTEKPDMIEIQETKSGLLDDDWIEDIWGGIDYGYTQLTGNGNSGGYYLYGTRG
ncbi:RNA-directed DNA polymerase, eukaryota, partial [Tanacetum coccineum]